MTQTGYLHGRPGHVVDHIIPLKRGGADQPWNMQWQTIGLRWVGGAAPH